MFDCLLIALREAFQASVLLALVLFSPPCRADFRMRRNVVLGFIAAALLGFSAGAVPSLSAHLGSHDAWNFWRLFAEACVFSSSTALLAARREPPRALLASGLTVLGFLLFFFESRSMGFMFHDLAALDGKYAAFSAAAAAGLLAGFLPLGMLRSRLRRLSLDRVFTLPSLLMTVGALQFWFGGVRELGGESILVPLQRGLQLFANESLSHARSFLLIGPNPFLATPFAGLARFLGSSSTAMTLTMLFLIVPPVFQLIVLFSRPDPRIRGDAAASRRRQDVAAFRADLSLRAAPVLAVFVVLVILLHAVNLSLNPLYDPEPVPVRETGNGATLSIPLSGKTGDLNDRLLRKFVYYRGEKQVQFLAIMKSDGTVGVALDQCEICRPADWNKDAQGYAQRGGRLICKFCMTPISVGTVNTPGGCNPIPVPFRIEGGNILISADALVAAFDRAERLERKGSHL